MTKDNKGRSRIIEPRKQLHFSLPVSVVEKLKEEARKERRAQNDQMIVILEERYNLTSDYEIRSRKKDN
jgi:hypothetical protein